LIQLLKICLVNKGELPLRQRDAAVWSQAGQPAQNTPCGVLA
jgi:hypothetical protein